jgi:hypothetical protein
LKKFNIFLLTLTIFSFCFYFVFFYFIERIEYSATTNEQLETNSDFYGIGLELESQNKETNKYYYKMITTRAESQILKKYEQTYEIKELFPTKKRTVDYHCVPTKWSKCLAVATYEESVVIPYMSKYLLDFSLLLSVITFLVYIYIFIEKKIKLTIFLIQTNSFDYKLFIKRNWYIFLTLFALLLSIYFFHLVINNMGESRHEQLQEEKNHHSGSSLFDNFKTNDEQ